MSEKVLLNILIDKELKKELADEAKEMGLPLTTYARTILINRKKNEKE